MSGEPSSRRGSAAVVRNAPRRSRSAAGSPASSDSPASSGSRRPATRVPCRGPSIRHTNEGSMKERLIGDDQLLVTADTTMGDPLWDWVAADAARRAPDGWRIANIGAVSTGRPPRTRPTATRRRRPASRSGSCTAGEPGARASRPSTRTPTARPTRRARRRIGPASGACPSAATTTAPPSTRSSTRRSWATSAWILDGQPYATPTNVWRQGDRLFWHGSAASRMLRATDGQPVCVTVTHLDGFVLARSGLQPLRQLPVRDGPGHGPSRDGRGGGGRRARRASSSTSSRVARRPCAR